MEHTDKKGTHANTLYIQRQKVANAVQAPLACLQAQVVASNSAIFWEEKVCIHIFSEKATYIDNLITAIF